MLNTRDKGPARKRAAYAYRSRLAVAAHPDVALLGVADEALEQAQARAVGADLGRGLVARRHARAVDRRPRRDARALAEHRVTARAALVEEAVHPGFGIAGNEVSSAARRLRP